MTTFPFDAQLASAIYRLGIFIRIDGLSPVLRFWLGIGDAVAIVDATDGTGATYSGLGQLLDVPAFNQVINGAADRFDVKLSGVSADVINMASTEADTIKGQPLNIAVGMFDKAWALIGNPSPLKRLVCDYVMLEGDAQRRTVGISARTQFTARRRPQIAFFTDEDQKRISSTDRFCESVARYNTGTVKNWPIF